MFPEMRVHIDRTEQIRLLSDLVDRDPKSSALVLLEAVELMGKSAFLVEVSEHLRDRATIVLTDLEAQPTIDDLLEDLAGKLTDQGVEMRAFNTRSDEFSTSGSMVVRNTTLRRSRLTMVTNSKESADLRQRALLRDFVADLQDQKGRLLVLFDSYERVGDEFRHWIRGPLVEQLLRVQGLVIVLAGRDLSKLRLPRRQLSLELAPFMPEHVVEWLVTLEATYTDETMRAVAHVLCLEHEGRPGRIDGVIQTLRKTGWGP